MLRDEAVARVKQGLGFKTNLDAEIVTAFQQLQNDLENSSELPVFLRKQYSAFNTIALNPALPVPADFIREWDEDLFSITTTDGTTIFTQPVVRYDEGYARLRWPTGDFPAGGLPVAYSRVYKTFRFYPTPDAIYGLNGSYYAKDQTLATNIENLWMKELPYILIARAGMQLAQGLRDKDALGSFGMMNDIYTNKLHLMTAADDAAGGKLVMGGED